MMTRQISITPKQVRYGNGEKSLKKISSEYKHFHKVWVKYQKIIQPCSRPTK